MPERNDAAAILGYGGRRPAVHAELQEVGVASSGGLWPQGRICAPM